MTLNNGLVLIKKEPQEKFSKGIWHPDPEIIAQYGRVILVSPDVEELRSGDRVIYQLYKEKAVWQEQVIIKEDFVVAKIEN